MNRYEYGVCPNCGRAVGISHKKLIIRRHYKGASKLVCNRSGTVWGKKRKNA